jgi:hypothetical protein
MGPAKSRVAWNYQGCCGVAYGAGVVGLLFLEVQGCGHIPWQSTALGGSLMDVRSIRMTPVVGHFISFARDVPADVCATLRSQ